MMHRIRTGKGRRLLERRQLLILLLTFSVVGAVAAGTVAAASAKSGRSESRHAIHMQSTLVSVTTNSAGNGGPGDVMANLWSFTTSTGVAGHADISCQAFPNSESLCHASFVFPDGQIEAMAAIPMPNTGFTAAIIGGSGTYVGTTGEIVNTPVSPGVLNRDFHLLSARENH
jgi:hypothetical protein